MNNEFEIFARETSEGTYSIDEHKDGKVEPISYKLKYEKSDIFEIQGWLDIIQKDFDYIKNKNKLRDKIVGRLNELYNEKYFPEDDHFFEDYSYTELLDIVSPEDLFKEKRKIDFQKIGDIIGSFKLNMSVGEIFQHGKDIVNELKVGKDYVEDSIEITKDYISKYGKGLKERMGDMLEEISFNAGFKLNLFGKQNEDEIKGLMIAKRMENEQFDNNEIWRRTGWRKNENGNWEFEGSNIGACLKDFPIFKAKKLGDIIEHDNLYLYFPQLKEVLIKNEKDKIEHKNNRFSFDTIYKEDNNKTNQLPLFVSNSNNHISEKYLERFDNKFQIPRFLTEIADNDSKRRDLLDNEILILNVVEKILFEKQTREVTEDLIDLPYWISNEIEKRIMNIENSKNQEKFDLEELFLNENVDLINSKKELRKVGFGVFLDKEGNNYLDFQGNKISLEYSNKKGLGNLLKDIQVFVQNLNHCSPSCTIIEKIEKDFEVNIRRIERATTKIKKEDFEDFEKKEKKKVESYKNSKKEFLKKIRSKSYKRKYNELRGSKK